MTICINGSKREFPKGITLEQLVEHLRLKAKSVVLELNQKVAERGAYSTTELQENDVVEIVHFVGGG